MKGTSIIFAGVFLVAGAGIGAAGIFGWQNVGDYFAPPLTRACESAIKGKLRSPSGYRRISLGHSKQVMTLDQFRDIELAKLRHIPLHEAYRQARDQLEKQLGAMETAHRTPVIYRLDFEYDAPNGYGALVRSHTSCEYTSYAGEDADLSSVQSFQVTLVD